MHTLLDFFAFIKGAEYLIAIAFLLTFVVFWRFVSGEGKKSIGKRVLAVLPLLGAGGIAVVVANYVTTVPSPASLPALAGEPRVFTFGVLAELYGPSAFGHQSHQRETKDCTLCHHHSEAQFPACRQCHATSISADDLNKPDLARVYHRRCISCHREKDSGPTTCTGCHIKASVPPLSIRHPLTARDKCLACHSGNVGGIPGTPEDHAGATNGVCQLCHKPLSEPAAQTVAPRAVPVGGGNPETTGPTPEASPRPAAPVPPRHGTKGMEGCAACHPPSNLPPAHAGMAQDICLACHKSD